MIENKKSDSDKITAANGAKISVTGYGDGKMTFGNGNVNVKGVMHVPDLAVNLLSVSQIVKTEISWYLTQVVVRYSTTKMKKSFRVKTVVVSIVLTLMTKSVFWQKDKRVL